MKILVRGRYICISIATIPCAIASTSHYSYSRSNCSSDCNIVVYVTRIHVRLRICRVNAYDRDTKLVTYFAQKVPFAFGEEGVFNFDWNHKITVRAETPCYVITINRHWLWHAAENVWEVL